MEATITSVRENPLLDRKEVELEIDHTGEATPGHDDVKDRLAAENNLDPENVEVESIYTPSGTNISQATVKVYEDFEYSEEVEETEAPETPDQEEVSEQDEEAEQDSDSEEEPETEEEEKEDESEESEAPEVDYDEIVDNTISDAKDSLKDLDSPDYEAALEAEQENKDRKTFVEWLENKAE